MLINPSDCPHDLIGKTASKEELCLKCMVPLKKLRVPKTLSISVHEEVGTVDAGPGQLAEEAAAVQQSNK